MTESDLHPNTETIAVLAQEFQKNRKRLRHIIQMRMSPMLFQRISPDDVTQEVYLAALRRIQHLEKNPEIPLFVKLRTLAFQTIIDFERKYLMCQKRDAYKDVTPDQTLEDAPSQNLWNVLPGNMTSPRSHLANSDRYELLHNALEELSPLDREILQLRHFEELSNVEVAHVLNIEQKTASIRYVRALKRFQEILMNYSEFRP